MTEPVDWIPPDMQAALEDTLAEGVDHDRLRAELGCKVQHIPGPLGDLLRTISVMYRNFLDAYEMRGTTEAEAIRMEQITDAGVELEVWLRSDQ
jgi:hypothetical protein